MLLLGGTIGTEMFAGTGEALAIAGPAPLLGVYIVICILVYGVITATSEMSTFVSRSLWFALGWLYFYSFAILVAYEIMAAGLV
ncbi:uncharacterized protein ACHE_51297S [Aspergillus chevalieri]|uniref:Amino acid permease/ SLC12A domain-containing protein n=1 Tax=Aspergillus chevalieri TaxID=182096 RepID=A0A7R7VU26_ASPCH|nr:uncharacterized protein ACHE_51297S [Aspergillus chevalieri]BCR90099.1 hypothetical protein ACHE_51297S [Aspergillus chevalieri]